MSTWGLLRDSLNLAIDGVPRAIDPHEIRDWLKMQDGVTDLHDLHIWPLSTTSTALTVHLQMPHPPAGDAFLHELAERLNTRFGISHATLQIERGDADVDCAQSDSCAS